MRWKNLKVSIYELKKAKEKVQKEHGENNNYKRKFSSFKDHILKIERFQTNLIKSVTWDTISWNFQMLMTKIEAWEGKTPKDIRIRSASKLSTSINTETY